MRHMLHDGTAIRVRPIEPADKARLEAGLRRLSDETIRRRFLAAKPRFSQRELRYLTEVDGISHIALVALLDRDPDTLVAVARAVRLPDMPDTAEFAIVVADPLQGQGLGSLLGSQLAELAQAAGIRRFAATVLSDNEPARRLISHIAGEFEHEQMNGSVRELVIDLAA
jgi:RimJ/RimL family protein N-acetyltransferase